MRINKEALIHKLPTLSDRATQRVRGDNEYVERMKQPNEALPLTFNRLKETSAYRTGDGEGTYISRSGSQDAFTKPSRGFST